jgi:hypothetical protein
MSPLEQEALGLGKLGLLASRAGFSGGECAAIRRHAEREESRGELARAAESYHVASVLEPGEAANWDGLARCWRRLGDPRGAHAQKVADAVRGRFT